MQKQIKHIKRDVMEYIDNNRIYRYYIAEGVTVAVWLLP